MQACPLMVFLLIPISMKAQTAPPQTVVPPAFAALARADTVAPRYGAAYDDEATALGLVPLRRLALPEGDAEIRIWSGWGIMAADRMVRLSRHGDRVDGGAGWHWKVDPHPAWTTIDATLRYQHSGQCNALKRAGDVEGCDARMARRPPWESLWDSLTRLSVWTLPDQATLPSDGLNFFDGWGMVVEVRSGGYFRSYSYSNPDAHRQPEQKLAAQIARLVDGIWDLVTPSSQTRTYRGRLNVKSRRGATFVACGASDRWKTGGNLDTLWYHSPPDDSTTVKSFFVVLRGMLSQPNPRIRRGAPSGRRLEVDTVNTATAWVGKHC